MCSPISAFKKTVFRIIREDIEQSGRTKLQTFFAPMSKNK
jgi:hypothetical protein